MNIDSIVNYSLGVAGIVIGILSSIYFYLKSKEVKEPRIYYQTYKNIDKIKGGVQNKDIKIFYKSEEVEKVFTTHMWFFNGGKKPIVKSDVPPGAGLNLYLNNKAGNLRILDYKIIKETRKPINAQVSKVNENTLSVDFEFLDYLDGWVTEIQHTGGVNFFTEVDGVILGNSEGVRVEMGKPGSYLDTSPREKSPTYFWSNIIVPIVMLWIFLGLFSAFVYNMPVVEKIYSDFESSLPVWLQGGEWKVFNLHEDDLVTILKAEVQGIIDSDIEDVVDAVREKSLGRDDFDYDFAIKIGLAIVIFATIFIPIHDLFFTPIVFPDDLTFDS